MKRQHAHEPTEQKRVHRRAAPLLQTLKQSTLTGPQAEVMMLQQSVGNQALEKILVSRTPIVGLLTGESDSGASRAADGYDEHLVQDASSEQQETLFIQRKAKEDQRGNTQVQSGLTSRDPIFGNEQNRPSSRHRQPIQSNTSAVQAERAETFMGNLSSVLEIGASNQIRPEIQDKVKYFNSSFEKHYKEIEAESKSNVMDLIGQWMENFRHLYKTANRDERPWVTYHTQRTRWKLDDLARQKQISHSEYLEPGEQRDRKRYEQTARGKMERYAREDCTPKGKENLKELLSYEHPGSVHPLRDAVVLKIDPNIVHSVEPSLASDQGVKVCDLY